MSIVANRPSVDRVIVRNVSWETYESLLKDPENCSSRRLTYDHGVLEIKSPHLEHESVNRALATIVAIALEEWDLDFEDAGSTTFRREILKRGFEPDFCFYIQNVQKIRHKKRIDMEVDPPPDLLIEIDLTSDSSDKFPLYAALGVPEVWRYKEALEIWILEKKRYVQRRSSVAMPTFNDKLVSELLKSREAMTRPAWLRQTRKRIRTLI